MEKAILVFSFYDAPKALRDLSPHGGDEDWIIVQRNVPADAKPEDLEYNHDFPGSIFAEILAIRYGDDDPPKLVEWEGTRCAVWIFAH